jgi:hypothetical protein
MRRSDLVAGSWLSTIRFRKRRERPMVDRTSNSKFDLKNLSIGEENKLGKRKKLVIGREAFSSTTTPTTIDLYQKKATKRSG